MLGCISFKEYSLKVFWVYEKKSIFLYSFTGISWFVNYEIVLKCILFSLIGPSIYS